MVYSMSIEQTTEISPQSRLGPSAEFPLVAISILNWNGWQDTLQCLESIRQLDYPNYLIIVVDNGSSNGSADKIGAWAEESFGANRVLADYSRETALAGGDSETERALDGASSRNRMVLIRNEENLGFTGGNNVSIHYALSRELPSDYVMTLNNDASLANDCLSQLVSVARKSGAGTVSATVFSGASGARDPGVYRNVEWYLFRFLPLVKQPFPPLPTDADFVWTPSSQGCAAVISRKLLRDIFRSRGEYLDNRLFMYYDEFELQFQARKHGYRAALAAKAFAFHKSGKGPSLDNLPVCYYFERNEIIVANRVLASHLKAIYHILNVPRLALRLAKWTAKGQRSMAKTILSAQWDGYRGIGGKWKSHDLFKHGKAT